jgi:predicted ATPase
VSQLRIRSLKFENFRGYDNAEFEFGDFSLLVGPNGIGKTTILDAITLLCSSLDFQDDAAAHPLVKSRITPAERTKAFLKKNIRNIDSDSPSDGFLVSGKFQYGDETIEVSLNQDGWVKNELRDKDWWWPGLSYFAQFDCNMTTFQLAEGLWDEFARAWEAITGFKAVDPERCEAAGRGIKVNLVVGFCILKPTGKIHCRKGSAGEKKIMKSLSQIVSLEKERQPDIVLIDNMEMHIHTSRHLTVADEVRKLFAGKQIIATTHSAVLIRNQDLREHIVDIGGTNDLKSNVSEYSISVTTNSPLTREQKMELLTSFRSRLVASSSGPCYHKELPDFVRGGKMNMGIRE